MLVLVISPETPRCKTSSCCPVTDCGLAGQAELMNNLC